MAVSTIKQPIIYKRGLGGSQIGADNTLITLGLLPSDGIYFIIVSQQVLSAADLCSIYTFRRSGDTLYKQSVIYEGTHINAPRITSDGKITKKDGSTVESGSTYVFDIIEFRPT